MARLWMAIEGKKKAWNLPDRPVVLGGGEGAQIRLDLAGLAARHCRLEPCPGGWRVLLLAGGDDLLLNGRAVKEGNLRHGDVVTLGGADLHFESEEQGVLQAVESPLASASRAAAPPSSSRRASAAPPRRGGGRSREREEPEERPRRGRGRSRQGEGLPGWAIVVLGLGGAALAVFLFLKVLGGTLTDVNLIIEQAEAHLRDGRLEDAKELIEKTKAKASPQEVARLEKMLADIEVRMEASRRENMIRGEFEMLKKFEDSSPVRSQRKGHVVYELLYRLDEFRRDNPNLPADIDKTIKDWENRYAGIVDMKAEPDVSWVTPLIRGPIGRSQHYKRPDLALKRMADLKLRFRSAVMQDHLAKLEEELTHIVNTYGRREVELTEEMIARGESHFPKLNEQLRDLRWMILTVGAPEWQEKGKAALAKLLAHRDKLRRIRDGEPVQ